MNKRCCVCIIEQQKGCDVMSVKVEVWGDYACFSRPELKTEKFTYEIITPSAARGILEAIYWHPGLIWIVDRVYKYQAKRSEIKNLSYKGQKRHDRQKY